MAITYRDIDIRQALEQKLHGIKPDRLREIIEDAIDAQEEKTLPGLGFLFELLWQASDDVERKAVLEKIAGKLT
ncbi:small acid-soluble spore protein SspI [Hydrogenibacillus sp. N12]|uniref:small acid-soluble spore protein SspI n=1 Tax=Hydrogenibacillus sp. N12 TaxID=2866627 RepID=UPI001C7CEF7A|nr:small acid-soluble spore protein SspI [Hydrogenibacillus sp. N12]QZA32435.1 small acid-soluble spore protein SspI [Hydrogenibacillus sp. N12]